MTRRRTLARRLARVEALLGRLTAKPVPSVLTVRVDIETRDDALERFDRRYPARGPLLIVPAKPSNDAEHESFASRFKASQLAVLAAVRSSYSNGAEPRAINPIYNGKRMTKSEAAMKPWKPGSL